MTGFVKNATDKNLRVWLSAGPVDRGIGDGLTFVATEAGARQGKASWILRYRFGGREREKVLGRYPDISLKEARELARADRALLQQGKDIAAPKRQERLKAIDSHDVAGLALEPTVIADSNSMRATLTTFEFSHLRQKSLQRNVESGAKSHQVPERTMKSHSEM